MLGSVAFDGFSRTATWQNRLFEIEAELISLAGLSDLVVTAVNILGLTVAVLLVAGFYLLAVAGARAVAHCRAVARRRVRLQPRPDRAARTRSPTTSRCWSTRASSRSRSPPTRSASGWDVLGTADFSPNLTALTPNMIWYTQVAVLVLGHVARARARPRPRDRAVLLGADGGAGRNTRSSS